MKKRSLALGIFLGFVAFVAMGIVFIDSTQNYWYVNGGFVKLIVSNQTQQAIMTVDTNTMRVGFNTNNIARSFVIKGRKPATNLTANGTSAATTGAIVASGGDGGESDVTATATGGAGGTVQLVGGIGGSANAATTNATGGAGGTVLINGGGGGDGSTSAATNATTGGAGGAVTIGAGTGGQPATVASTNTVGGNGGNTTITSGTGGSLGSGWARKGGNGGQLNFSAGNGAIGTRTNGGDGGSYTMTAGSAGTAGTGGNAGLAGTFTITAGNSANATGGGNPTPGGDVMITAGSGASGTTNSDAGHVFIAGGAPGTGAVPGNVVLARTAAGVTRGAGVQIGPLITGGSATITNVLGAAASLDFPSTVAGTFSELTIAVTGVTSNNVAVSLSVPWQSAQTGGAFVTFNSNDVIYVRFINNQLVSAIDPAPGSFAVVGFRIR